LNASDAALIGSVATDGRFQVLLVIGRVSCEPERREDLIGLLRRMQEDSRREEGCLRYGFFAAVEDENSYIAVEEWTDREALDRHFAEPHLHEFSARLLELVSQRPEVAIHEVAGTSSFPDRPA
jgi:quinol monooxygenase YgiN